MIDAIIAVLCASALDTVQSKGKTIDKASQAALFWSIFVRIAANMFHGTSKYKDPKMWPAWPVCELKGKSFRLPWVRLLKATGGNGKLNNVRRFALLCCFCFARTCRAHACPGAR